MNEKEPTQKPDAPKKTLQKAVYSESFLAFRFGLLFIF